MDDSASIVNETERPTSQVNPAHAQPPQMGISTQTASSAETAASSAAVSEVVSPDASLAVGADAALIKISPEAEKILADQIVEIEPEQLAQTNPTEQTENPCTLANQGIPQEIQYDVQKTVEFLSRQKAAKAACKASGL